MAARQSFPCCAQCASPSESDPCFFMPKTSRTVYLNIAQTRGDVYYSNSLATRDPCRGALTDEGICTMTTTHTDTLELVVTAFVLPEAMVAFQAPAAIRQQLRQQYSRLLIAVGKDTASADTHLLREHLFRLCGMEPVSARHLFRVDQYECSDFTLKRVRTDLLELLIDRLTDRLEMKTTQVMLEHGCSVAMIMRLELIMQYFMQFRRPHLAARYADKRDTLRSHHGFDFESLLALSHAAGTVSMTVPIGEDDSDLVRLWLAFRTFGLSTSSSVR